MHQTEIQIRVRYGETDRMGYVYYGNYAQYFEVGRVEALRNLGISYKQMEDEGILLPVHSFSVKYFKPALYDDLLTIKTRIVSMKGVRIIFENETFNQQQELLNTAEVVLVFFNRALQKPCSAPEKLESLLRKFI